MDVNSIYGSTFSQGNTSSGHFQNTISSNTSTFIDAGNVMLPSPIYGAKVLNYYLHQPHQQHSLQTQQEDTIISQIPTNIKQEISISHQNPPNELKPEVFIYFVIISFMQDNFKKKVSFIWCNELNS